MIEIKSGNSDHNRFTELLQSLRDCNPDLPIISAQLTKEEFFIQVIQVIARKRFFKTSNEVLAALDIAV